MHVIFRLAVIVFHCISNDQKIIDAIVMRILEA